MPSSSFSSYPKTLNFIQNSGFLDKMKAKNKYIYYSKNYFSIGVLDFMDAYLVSAIKSDALLMISLYCLSKLRILE